MQYSKVKAYKYKLEQTELRKTDIIGYSFSTRYFAMRGDGSLFVKYSYAWDGSSIPYKKVLRVLSFWLYDPDRYCKTASLIHDAICQAIREGLLPAKYKLQIDLLYKDMCIEGGMSIQQANRRYLALRKYGDGGIEPEKEPRNKIYDTLKT